MDYVYGDGPPPPELVRAFDYKAWGVDVHDLPPGMIRSVSQAWNVYSLMSEYRGAAGRNKSADWTNAHPQKWEQVSRLLADRMKRRRNG